MPKAKDGFPEKLKDSQIKEELEKFRHLAIGGQYDAKWVTAANSIIQSGQNELSGRFQRRTFYMMLGLTVLSIAAAGVSVYFSFRADNIDRQWQTEEISILQQIRDSLKGSK